MYDWVDAKITSISSALSTKVALGDANIMVGDPSEWSVLPVLGEKRICKSFDDCMVPFYECLFTGIRLRLPFLNLS